LYAWDDGDRQLYDEEDGDRQLYDEEDEDRQLSAFHGCSSLRMILASWAAVADFLEFGL
tara:strand:+ start:1150 stop:1326 length:177 start_codon:yes stop_codon:yes gene_type:complete